MAFALVGAYGTPSQGASGASVTPAWGAGANRTAGNLLVLTFAVTGVTTAPTVTAGWIGGAVGSGASCYAAIYYKVASGGDAAPTVNGVASGVISAQLAEYSGQAAGDPKDGGSASTQSTTSPVTTTLPQIDASAGELLIMVGADKRSTARASNDTWTSNRGTPTLTGSNNGVTSTEHYSFGAILSTNSNANADTATMTLSVTTNITGLFIIALAFKLPPQIISPSAIASAESFGTATLVATAPTYSQLIRGTAGLV